MAPSCKTNLRSKFDTLACHRPKGCWYWPTLDNLSPNLSENTWHISLALSLFVYHLCHSLSLKILFLVLSLSKILSLYCSHSFYKCFRYTFFFSLPVSYFISLTVIIHFFLNIFLLPGFFSPLCFLSLSLTLNFSIFVYIFLFHA